MGANTAIAPSGKMVSGKLRFVTDVIQDDVGVPLRYGAQVAAPDLGHAAQPAANLNPFAQGAERYVGLQRLNRTEYAAAVKELVGVEIVARDVLPQDAPSTASTTSPPR